MECENCGSEYKNLGAHWAHSPTCDYPNIDDTKRNIIQGLLMGDASVEDRGSAGRMSVTISNEDFLQWVDEKLGVLSLGVKNYYSAKEQAERVSANGDLPIKDHHEFDKPFELKTRSHPYFKELRSWYDSGAKRFPSDLDLTPLKAKIWYCCDGSLIRSEKQRPHLRFYTKNERDRIGTLTKYFHDKGLEAREYEGAVGFTADETERVLEWMGKPPSGMQYKWI